MPIERKTMEPAIGDRFYTPPLFQYWYDPFTDEGPYLKVIEPPRTGLICAFRRHCQSCNSRIAISETGGNSVYDSWEWERDYSWNPELKRWEGEELDILY